MSIVVVTDDKFREKRESSKSEELKIDRHGSFKRWQMRPNIMSYSTVMRILGFLAIPILLLWMVILVGISAAIYLSVVIMKMVGSLIPGKKTIPVKR